MMMSPECFYETKLKGKTPEEIARKIRGLKRKIGHLKRILEAPYNIKSITVCPDESIQLYYTRLYLKRAIAAYEEAGGTYVPNRNEQRAATFEAAIPMITKIVFSIGGFFEGYDTYTFLFAEKCIRRQISHAQVPGALVERVYADSNYPFTKEEFLEKFRDIHMGEWHKAYSNPGICDGAGWDITIEYADGRTTQYDGYNAFPFSFNQFCELVEYEEESEEEPENDCDDE